MATASSGRYPAKGKLPQCVACFKQKVWRTYDIGGNKWKKENLKEKLQDICGKDVYSAMEEEKIGICHSCLCRLQTSFSFAEQTRQNVARLGHLAGTGSDTSNSNQDKHSNSQGSLQLHFDTDVLDQWRQLAKILGVETDSELACHLLKEFAARGSGSTNVCEACGSSLQLCCTSCWQKELVSSTITPDNQQKAPITFADFTCMFPEEIISQGTNTVARATSVTELQSHLEVGPCSRLQGEERLVNAGTVTKAVSLQQASPISAVSTEVGSVHLGGVVPSEALERGSGENFSCMFSFMEEQQHHHHHQQPQQQQDGHAFEHQPQPASRGTNLRSSLVMDHADVTQPPTWTCVGDNMASQREPDEKFPFIQPVLLPHKDNIQQPSVGREDIAERYTLRELLQPTPGAHPSSPRKKMRRRLPVKDGKPRPFVCRECSMAFSTSTSLRRHLRIHTGEKPYKCSHCGDAFRQSNGLKRHVFALHSGNKRYSCKRCSATFPSYKLLLDHKQSQSHKRIRPFSCDDCGATFRNTSALKSHKNTHSGLHVQVQCSTCITEFETVQQLRDHERSEHREVSEAWYKCTECSRAFKTPRILKEHMKVHVPGGPHMCHVCDKSSTTLFEARKHMFSAHPGKKVKTFSCDECGKCFTSESYARFHQAAHSGEKPFVCRQCGAAFHYPANLHVHEKIHSGVRNYICKHCGVKFLRQPHLKKHLKLHEGDELFPCPECGVSFNSKRYLGTHMHSHEKDKRRFVCEVCGMKQWSGSALRQHMRTHTGEKPHVCDVCGAAFTWSSGLKYHMRYHDNKNCVCEVCGAGFIWKSELKNHMESHSNATTKSV